MDPRSTSPRIGPGVSQECRETEDGPHVREDHVCRRFLDPITGEVLPEGEDTVGTSVDVLVVDPESLPRWVGRATQLVDRRDSS